LRFGERWGVGGESWNRLLIGHTHILHIHFDPCPAVTLLDQRELLERERTYVGAFQSPTVLAQNQREV